MPRGFAGEDERGRASDPSGNFGGGFGFGVHDDVIGQEAYGGPSFGGEGGSSSGSVTTDPTAVQKAIEQAKKGKTIGFVENLGGGKQRIMDNLGNVTIQNAPQTGGIGSFLEPLGWDPKKGFLDNLYESVVPGKRTPLGILSITPQVLGANKFVSGLTSLANQVAGDLGIGVQKPEVNIAEQYVDPIMQVGIASGKPTTAYTGRPDDAATPSAGLKTFDKFSVGDQNFILGKDGPILLSGVPEQEAKTEMPLADTQGLKTPDEHWANITGQNTKTLTPYTTKYGLSEQGQQHLRNKFAPEGIQKISDTNYLSQIQEGLQKLADNIVEIPGGYMDTNTGKTYSGKYRPSTSAQTYTGKQKSYTPSFTWGSFKQNLFGT